MCLNCFGGTLHNLMQQNIKIRRGRRKNDKYYLAATLVYYPPCSIGKSQFLDSQFIFLCYQIYGNMACQGTAQAESSMPISLNVLKLGAMYLNLMG